MKAVRSLYELRNMAKEDGRYAQLAVIGARNLGGNIKDGDVDRAIDFLWEQAEAAEMEGLTDDGEAGVVGEVNYCRDMVKP